MWKTSVGDKCKLPTCLPYLSRTLGALGRMSLHLSSYTCLPHLSPTLGVLGRMSLHLSPLVSHTCFPLWVPWAAWAYTCLPLIPHTCLPLWVSWAAWVYTCLHLSPTLVSHSRCLGPNDFTLVSHLSLTLGCLRPHEFTLVFPHLSRTLGALGRMSLHLSYAAQGTQNGMQARRQRQNHAAQGCNPLKGVRTPYR